MEPWISKVFEIQEEIQSLNCHPYYIKAYRAAEMNYWMRIARWIHDEEKEVEKCLDIGCAYGTLSLYAKKLFGCEVHAIDFMKYISDDLVRKYDFQYAINNIELDPFPWDSQYDMIIFTEVLEHLNFNALPTLKKIRGLLNEQGRIYVSTPDASQWGRVTKYYKDYRSMPYPQRGLPIVDDHVYQFNEEELRSLLEEAGLEIMKFDYAPGVQYLRHFNLKLCRK